METPVYDRMARALQAARTVLAEIVGSASKLEERKRHQSWAGVAAMMAGAQTIDRPVSVAGKAP